MLLDEVLEILSREHQELAVANRDDGRRAWLIRNDGHLADHLIAPDFADGRFYAVALLDLDAKPAADEDVQAIRGIALSHQEFAGSQIHPFAAAREFLEEGILQAREQISCAEQLCEFRTRIRSRKRMHANPNPRRDS
ncbi:MAG: hypothetical protein VX681_13685 [Myxococcota bacterium]|nr:hypothetical protein [Myxococcota bacterium]